LSDTPTDTACNNSCGDIPGGARNMFRSVLLLLYVAVAQVQGPFYQRKKLVQFYMTEHTDDMPLLPMFSMSEWTVDW
jgi:hypothetical protein